MALKLKFRLYRLVTLIQKISLQLIPIPKPLVLSGDQSSLSLVRAIGAKGYRRVLLVSDSELTRLGLLGPILSELEGLGIAVATYTEVLPDPDVELIARGLEASRQHKADLILAVGGGSVLDAAKLIAALNKRKGSMTRKIGIMRIIVKGLPLYAVPTTAGTGSEATMVAVITLKDQAKKVFYVDPVLMPTATALDPSLCLGLPANLTAATGMDALTHAIEALLSKNATAQTDKQAIEAVRTIFTQLPRCYHDGSNLAARQDMLKASQLAGAAFNIAGVGYVHAIAHQLGARYALPHGLANAIVLPTILNWYLEKVPHQIRQVEDKVYPDYRPNQHGRLLRDIKSLCLVLHIPSTLDDLKQADISMIAHAAITEAKYLYAVPAHMTQSECVQVLKSLMKY
ncbi:MAG: iron-containing alcohol dehydrogenase [Gammaproteobacteria bacterium]|nr:iron-containing alcohol dehydrogenase [Gammaproteobacteria bacterium]